MQVTIIEDEPQVQDQLARLLRQYAAVRRCPVEICQYKDGQSFLDAGEQPEILLLDIQMPGLDGMTLARRIRQRGSGACIIFVTSMAGYAVQGYQVEALDFLITPVEAEPLFSALDRAVRRLEYDRPHCLNLRAGASYHHLDLRQLLYAEAGRHKLMLHTTGGVIECPGSIRGLEKQLESQGFFCCHAAFLVSLAAVTRVDGNELLIGGQRVPVSKHRRRALLEKLAQYWGEQL